MTDTSRCAPGAGHSHDADRPDSQNHEPEAGPGRGGVAARRQLVPIALVFTLGGFALGSVVSRIPAMRDSLHLDAAHMGLLLLCPGVGSMIGLPVAGKVVPRLGPARTVLIGATGVAAALGITASSLVTGIPAAAAAGLLLWGLSVGHWDVAMNVAGAAAEQRRGRPLLPRLHAGYSAGSIAGAGVGAGAAAAGISAPGQWTATAVLVLVGVLIAVRGLHGDDQPGRRPRDGRPIRLATAWREPRTVLIGASVLAFALAEGTATNWLPLALIDGHHSSEALGAVAYGVFVTAVTAGRASGELLLQRAGRVGTLRLLAATTAAGVVLVVFAGPLPLVLAGALLWGAGASLGFPVGMSAAGDDPVNAAPRVSVVSSIGYSAFFAGPPLIGFLADRAGILTSLLVVLVALAVAVLTSSATRPLDPDRPPP